MSVKTVAIVMDGNRRWARQNNLPFSLGQRKGVQTLVEITKEAKKKKVKKLIVYAFSSENWSRENFEVNALMNLINFGADVKLDEIKANGIRLTFIGDIENMPKKAKEGISKCIDETKYLKEFNLIIALNYGSIWDMVNAANVVNNSGAELTQKNFIKHTQLGELDIDIFIRTGGDMRLSNFLLPNIGYSELIFSEKLWPEFNPEDFQEILKEFKVRQRRFGK